MSLIPRLVLVIAACSGLLVGIQIPNFVDQYQKRLDAHLREVQHHLRGFQEVADRYDGGSLESLILRHERSADPAFRAEALPIRRMVDRYRRYASRALALQVGLPRQVLAIATDPDRELLDETWRQYSYAILLDRDAVLAGFALMACVVLVLEPLAALLRRFRPLPRG